MSEGEAPALPIDAVLEDLNRGLRDGRRLVLQADPGAGKSTRVPQHLAGAEWLGGQAVIMLEPRRIAARNLAAFLAEQLGEPVGGRVGLQIRDERRISETTRLFIVTEGILTRRLQGDPELSGVGLVVFDEFHERHLQTDLALALALDAQQQLREDLRILVMSATMDVPRVAAWLDAQAITCPGRRFEITTRYRRGSTRRFEPGLVADACRDALAQTEGDVLAFLPGQGEIQRTAGMLAEKCPAEVRSLYGALPLADQREALRPGRRRRVVLATNIAESSLTVPGITAVVDSGLEKVPEFDPTSGLTRLLTRRVSGASADQRAGRAGRLGPGLCLRLWSEDERLVPARPPEIAAADLSGLVLELAAWGCEPGELRWLDPPAAGALAQGADLLTQLGALDRSGHITAFGRRLLRWGTEPRLAAMLEGADGDRQSLACDLAALLEGRNPLWRDPGGDDLAEAWKRWQHRDLPRGVLARLNQAQDRWRRRAGLGAARRTATEEAIGPLLAAAYPDRVAKRRGTGRGYQLANGRGVMLAADSGLQGAPWLVVCDAALEEGDSPVRWGTRISAAAAEELSAERAESVESVSWDADAKAVVAERQLRLGAIVLDRKPWADAPPERIAATLIEQLRKQGIRALALSGPTERLRRRVTFARRLEPERWPDWSDTGLLEGLDSWLGPYLVGETRMAAVANKDLKPILLNELGWERREALDQLAPERIEIPSGRDAAIDYSDPDQPTLSVKLQEMFGCRTTPTIGGGRVPLTISLLSPAGRPLQITSDLGHFWTHGYVEVRKEMRGRYPKHPWPEDPLTAKPTARTKAANRMPR